MAESINCVEQVELTEEDILRATKWRHSGRSRQRGLDTWRQV